MRLCVESPRGKRRDPPRPRLRRNCVRQAKIKAAATPEGMFGAWARTTATGSSRHCAARARSRWRSRWFSCSARRRRPTRAASPARTRRCAVRPSRRARHRHRMAQTPHCVMTAHAAMSVSAPSRPDCPRRMSRPPPAPPRRDARDARPRARARRTPGRRAACGCAIPLSSERRESRATSAGSRRGGPSAMRQRFPRINSGRTRRSCSPSSGSLRLRPGLCRVAIRATRRLNSCAFANIRGMCLSSVKEGSARSP